MDDDATEGPMLLWWLVVVVALIVVRPAWAEPRQETDADSEQEARRHFRAGAEYFYQGEYAEALVEFKRADHHTDRALVPYNIALVYSRMGRPDKALEYAREARSRGGLNAESSTKNEGRIRGLNRQRIARRVVANVAGRGTSTDGSSPTLFGGVDFGSVGTLGWIGIGTATAGVAALAGAGGVEGSLRNDLDRYRRLYREGDSGRARRLGDRIERRQGLGKFFLWKGIGLTATGATLGLLDVVGVEWPFGADRRVSIRPSVGRAWGLQIELSGPVTGRTASGGRSP